MTAHEKMVVKLWLARCKELIDEEYFKIYGRVPPRYTLTLKSRTQIALADLRKSAPVAIGALSPLSPRSGTLL